MAEPRARSPRTGRHFRPAARCSRPRQNQLSAARTPFACRTEALCSCDHLRQVRLWNGVAKLSVTASS